ncbi:virion structural protein [Pseudomonas phage WP1]
MVGGATFFGILGHPKRHALYGSAGNSLAPGHGLPDGSEGEFFDNGHRPGRRNLQRRRHRPGPELRRSGWRMYRTTCLPPTMPWACRPAPWSVSRLA